MLTAEAILGTQDRVIKIEDVPEWPENGAPGKVGIRTLSGTERGDFMESANRDEKAGKTDSGMRKRLLGLCLCDADGNRLFTDDQVGALMAKNSVVLNRLFLACVRLNALGPKDTDDAEKN